MKAVMVDDIKLTVADFTIGCLTPSEIVKMQRYFIREYCAWMPFRAIAEVTGCTDHATVIQSISEVKQSTRLREMVKPLKQIFDTKILGLEHSKPIVKWYPGRGQKVKK